MSAGDADDAYAVQADIDRSSPQSLVDSSFDLIMSLSHTDVTMMHAIDVMFVGETGFGLGVARDWIASLCQALRSPATGLFVSLQHAPHVVHPDASSACEERGPRTRGLWMEFVGRVLGLAIRMGVPTGVHLSTPLFHLMRDQGCLLTLDDMRDVEPEVHQSCMHIMQAPTQQELDTMLLPGFAVSDRELLPGGAGIRVTLENRALLLQLMVEHYCNRDNTTLDAAMAMRAGMAFAAPADVIKTRALLAGLTPHDFNIEVGGQPVIKTQDIQLRCSVEKGPGVAADTMTETASAFWGMVDSMGMRTRQRLLQFWTGSSSLAASNMNLAMIVVNAVRGSLPTSRTCYCQLYVPAGGASAGDLYAVFQRALIEAPGIDDENIVDNIDL
jgi:E3 ubiquitin-protein ligase HUWE1